MKKSHTKPVASRYAMTQLDRAGHPPTLRIEGEDRNPVNIVQEATHFAVECGAWGGVRVRETFGIFEFYQIVRTVALALMSFWESPKGGHCPRAVEVWAREQTARAMGKRLHRWWKGRLSETDPTVLAVQRGVCGDAFCPRTALRRRALQ